MLLTRTPISTATGHAFPLGPSVVADGVNFSLYSSDASGVELLFFDQVDDARPSSTITLDPVANRSYHYWHAFAPGIESGQLYGYRVHGPFVSSILLNVPHCQIHAASGVADRISSPTSAVSPRVR